MDSAGENVDEISSPLKSFMKWVGIVAAILSLIAGARQFLTMTLLLEEAGGQPASALKTWRAVRANQAEASSPLARRADAAIKRLSR